MNQIFKALSVLMIATAASHAHALNYTCKSLGNQNSATVSFTIRQTMINSLTGILNFRSPERPLYTAPLACNITTYDTSKGISCVGLVQNESNFERAMIRIVLTVANDAIGEYVGKGVVSNQILDGLGQFPGYVACKVTKRRSEF